LSAYLTYIKLGAAAALLAIAAGSGYHFGGLSAKSSAEAAHAAQLQAVTDAYQKQVLATAASEAKLQKAENDYDAIKDLPDPVTTGLASRVLLHACPAGGGDVPQARTVASGAPGAAQEPSGDSGFGGRLQAVLDACTADSRQMSAMIDLAPK
jgi:hypothetical protein